MSRAARIVLAFVLAFLCGASALAETARVGFQHTFSAQPPSQPTWIGEGANGSLLVLTRAGTQAFRSAGSTLLRVGTDGSVQTLGIFPFGVAPDGDFVRSGDGNF